MDATESRRSVCGSPYGAGCVSERLSCGYMCGLTGGPGSMMARSISGAEQHGAEGIEQHGGELISSTGLVCQLI